MKLLVLGECPDFRSRMRFILECDGHRVLEARDALAGLQRAVEDAPQLILVEASLSGLSADWVRGQLAEEPTTRAVPVVLVDARGVDAAPSPCTAELIAAGLARPRSSCRSRVLRPAP